MRLSTHSFHCFDCSGGELHFQFVVLLVDPLIWHRLFIHYGVLWFIQVCGNACNRATPFTPSPSAKRSFLQSQVALGHSTDLCVLCVLVVAGAYLDLGSKWAGALFEALKSSVLPLDKIIYINPAWSRATALAKFLQYCDLRSPGKVVRGGLRGSSTSLRLIWQCLQPLSFCSVLQVTLTAELCDSAGKQDPIWSQASGFYSTLDLRCITWLQKCSVSADWDVQYSCISFSTLKLCAPHACAKGFCSIFTLGHQI